MSNQAFAGAFRKGNVIDIHPSLQDSTGKLVGILPCTALSASASAGKIGKAVARALNHSQTSSASAIDQDAFLLAEHQALGIASREELASGARFVFLSVVDDIITMSPTRHGPEHFEKLEGHDVTISSVANHKSIGEALVRAWSLCQ